MALFQAIKMNILHLEAHNYPEATLNLLRKVGSLTIADCKNEQEFRDTLSKGQYEVIFTTIGFSLNEESLGNQMSLHYIVSPTTGLNHIDLTYTQKKNMQVISLKGERDFLKNVKSTAEHTWALLLSLVRQVNLAVDSVAKNEWNREKFLCDELNTKTIGVIGYGRLGEIICEYASVFGMKVLVCETEEKRQQVAEKRGFSLVKLPELLKLADNVLLMASYSPENENLMGKKEFSYMKEQSYFVNTSRGEMVDEQALLWALDSKILKGAALDVLRDDSSWRDNTPQKHPLIEYSKNNKNLIITPHIGGYGEVSIALTRDFITNKFIKEFKKQ